MTPYLISNAILRLLPAIGSAIFAVAALSVLFNKRIHICSNNGLILLMMFLVGIAGMNHFIGVSYIQRSIIGGDAFGGKIVGDHYYLGNHGNYVEVSHAGYWISFWYTFLSGIAVTLPFIIMVILGIFGTRRPHDNWLDRVRSLGEQNDLDSLYNLIEMIDHYDESRESNVFTKMFERSAPDHAIPPPEERRVLCQAIRKRVSFIDTECPLPLSESAPIEVIREQKEMWYKWVRSHEDLFL